MSCRMAASVTRTRSYETLAPDDRPGLCNQPSQCLEVSLVEWIDLNHGWRATLRLGRLEQHRQAAKPPIVHDAAEGFESEAALADVLVSIDAAAERPLRVAQVE